MFFFFSLPNLKMLKTEFFIYTRMVLWKEKAHDINTGSPEGNKIVYAQH